MSGLNYNFPLGARIPDSMHSVVCSIPTVADVRGYEEKDPETLSVIKAAYPRFFRHEYLQLIDRHVRQKHGLPGRVFYPLTSLRSAEEMVNYCGHDQAAILETEDLFGVHVQEETESCSRAWSFLQHTGCAVSSRQAEDWLNKHALLNSIGEEPYFEGNADMRTSESLRAIYGLESVDDILLCNSGMNAFYASYRAISEFQKSRGKNKWLQLGWLYVDTGLILEKFSETEPIIHFDLFNFDGLRKIFAEHGNEIAGIITEVPTNPLLQTSDIEELQNLAEKHNAVLILDPTLASPCNIDILPYADLVINSLTKYAASEGDVLSGAAIFNPASSFHEELKTNLPHHHEPPYSRDLQRLAQEIEAYPQYVEKVNRNVSALAPFLETHPSIKKVYWSYEEQSHSNYEKIARTADSPGCMLTIFLNKPLADFYDRVKTVKGPSFGTNFTLMCPFMHLAHYDLVSKKAGRDYLWSLNLDPDLVRISVGTEDPVAIIETFTEAL